MAFRFPDPGAVMSNAKLKRSNDRMIAGVCGGLAEWLGWKADRVRVVYVIVSILSIAFHLAHQHRNKNAGDGNDQQGEKRQFNRDKEQPANIGHQQKKLFGSC